MVARTGSTLAGALRSMLELNELHLYCNEISNRGAERLLVPVQAFQGHAVPAVPSESPDSVMQGTLGQQSELLDQCN